MALTFKDLHWAKNIQVQQYLQPETLEEALEMLANFEGKARVIAGGTDVVPQLRGRDIEVEALVDVTGIPGMDGIDQDGENIVLGGLVTHAQVASSDLIRNKALLLSEGAGSVGSPQIRNIATVAGNLVSGQPGADTSIPLLALDATVTIASGDGERKVPLTAFFLDKGKTVLDCTREILTSIQFRGLMENQGGCYLRLAKRKALTLPMLVLAAVVNADPGKEIINRAAIAMGPVAPVPYRATNVEAWLKGAPISDETFAAAADMGMQECAPRDSCLRGSCDYRQEMSKVFIKRGLTKATANIGS
ncbi:MAG: xanthine dehydrogenase family protein subunit M [Deltaproteobacteria bacterium]|nr:xanthine dehydrogenase family protein subunit M [Deltaproteobacteria bacterium]